MSQDVLSYSSSTNNAPEFITTKPSSTPSKSSWATPARRISNLRQPVSSRPKSGKSFSSSVDGVKGAINKILKHNGCIVADSVGLGKTYEALAVIKY